MKFVYKYTSVITVFILLFLFSACSQKMESLTPSPVKGEEIKTEDRTQTPSPGEKPAAGEFRPPRQMNNEQKNEHGESYIPGVHPEETGNPGSQGEEVPPPDRGRLQVNVSFKQNEKDGEQMVLIPAGSFKMGAAPGDDLAKSDEKPLHEVYLDSYYIYVREVSNCDFQKFVKKTGYYTTAETRGEKKNWRGKRFDCRLDAPVINITYADAMAYCEWVGGRLPTEAEWEKAARGPNDVRIYPWGNKLDTELFNSDMLSFKKYQGVCVGNDIYRAPCRTGMFDDGRSPCETRDMIGNAWEWCLDWYDMQYYKSSPAKNPMGPGEGKYRVLKGGGMIANPVEFRISNRKYDLPDAVDSTYGFRCVLPVEN